VQRHQVDRGDDRLTTPINGSRLRQPTRWDSEKKQQKRITSRDKVVILNAYEKGLRRGEHRDELLQEIAQVHGKSTRQVERYISDARRQREIKAGPYLEMEFIPVKVYTDERRISMCACVNVWNRGSMEARRCWGTLRLLSLGDSSAHKYQEAIGLFRLHWAGLPFEEEAPTVDIPAEGHPCRLDIAFSLPPPLERAQPDSAITSGRIAMLSGLHEIYSGRGCWIAVSTALLRPDVTNSFYLVPGSYQVAVTVGWADQRGQTQEFMLVSPSSWEGLSLVPHQRLGHRGSPS
jgi:hypothetical protein